jgi:hypothetical protein
MNWAIPWAPAEDTARGLNRDSAISWAASSPGETFQRAAERMIGSRNCAGTKDGNPGAPSRAPETAVPIVFAAPEQGGGPPS